uniref:hypothetical protein n=1 Tax=Microbulbifer agarilyticus TaxID=260552 RepID=UPI0002558E35|nr:hypothetical protein [Microbulbifer agarilyticus]
MKHAIFTIFIYLVSTCAHACTCVELTDREKIDKATKIFAGKVVKSEFNEQYEVESLIKVEKIFKGNVSKLEEIRSSGDSSSCGVEEVVGFNYLIFTDEAGEASICYGHEEYNPKYLELSGDHSPGRLLRALSTEKHNNHRQ